MLRRLLCTAWDERFDFEALVAAEREDEDEADDEDDEEAFGDESGREVCGGVVDDEGA